MEKKRSFIWQRCHILPHPVRQVRIRETKHDMASLLFHCCFPDLFNARLLECQPYCKLYYDICTMHKFILLQWKPTGNLIVKRTQNNSLHLTPKGPLVDNVGMPPC